jgi:hypothetical protein
MLAGASAVQVGTASFRDPGVMQSGHSPNGVQQASNDGKRRLQRIAQWRQRLSWGTPVFQDTWVRLQVTARAPESGESSSAPLSSGIRKSVASMSSM